MDRPTALPFRLGEWRVDPVANRIRRDGDAVRLEPRMMRLLLCFAARPADVISADDLLDQAWPGVIVSPDSVYQGVAALRRVLGDDPKDPRYLVTVPRQGYRLIAAVTPLGPDADADRPSAERVADAAVPTHAAAPAAALATAAAPTRSRFLVLFGVLAAVLALALLLAAYRMREAPPPPSAVAAERSVAVLPFLDLTEAMGEEVFADGMTEELIDRLARIPGLHVPPPTASFWFKDKQLTVAEIARQLGVAWLVDGSVRKSGATMRVAARLVRARDGFVVWSDTYDRPIDDRLMIQDDIAGEVGKAIEAQRQGPLGPD